MDILFQDPMDNGFYPRDDSGGAKNSAGEPVTVPTTRFFANGRKRLPKTPPSLLPIGYFEVTLSDTYAFACLGLGSVRSVLKPVLDTHLTRLLTADGALDVLESYHEVLAMLCDCRTRALEEGRGF